MTRFAAALALAAALLPGSAQAYRPFDSTDAAVAAEDEAELELGPVGRRKEGPRRILVAPAAVANLGLSGDRELVVQGQRERPLDRAAGEPGAAIVDNGVFVKQVLRRGVLQDQHGVSVATEYGLLLPPTRGPGGTGFSVAGIVSQQWEAATIHLNGALARSRDHEPDLFVGAILEGPGAWPVRPVAEVFGERERGAPRTRSRLVGAIWRAGESLSFDVGLREGRFGSEPVHELRLGLTWGFSVGKER